MNSEVILMKKILASLVEIESKIQNINNKIDAITPKE